MWDAVVVGGGFYGVAVARYLVERRGLAAVCLVEREAALLRRASLRNQARVHNGCHYPRSFTTAFRSGVNLPRFVADFAHCVVRDFRQLYAIARCNSRVTARQFRRFCGDIGARVEPAAPEQRALFEPALIEDVFEVEEYAFDGARLGAWARDCLAERRIVTKLETVARIVDRAADGTLRVQLDGAGGSAELSARFLFNCTYSGLNQIGGVLPPTTVGLKHELTELALVDMPPAMARIGVTVMDGPYFSTMPYPAAGAHSLSHVRYTPHQQWADVPGEDPDRRLAPHGSESRADFMIRDALRYLPAIADARYRRSIFEVKTVLAKNEVDDGRPILFERHAALPGAFSILGGKIDNIYDVLERLDREVL